MRNSANDYAVSYGKVIFLGGKNKSGLELELVQWLLHEFSTMRGAYIMAMRELRWLECRVNGMG